MNGTVTFGDEVSPARGILRCTGGAVLPVPDKGKNHSAMMAFAIAVAGTSVICYALMTGAEKIKRGRPTTTPPTAAAFQAATAGPLPAGPAAIIR